jgi:uncharacterized iron-regulated membrane protein
MNWWKVHSLSTVWASGFLLFLFATGVLALFTEHALRLENLNAAYVPPAPAWKWSGLAPSIRSASQAVWTRNSNAKLECIDLPDSTTHALRVQFIDPDRFPKPFRKGDSTFSLGVFVNPANAEVMGSYDALRSIDVYLRALHVRFFAGTIGRKVAGVFGGIMLIALLSGLMILFKFMVGRHLLRWRRSSPRAFASDGHKSLAVFTLPFLLIFAITGFWLGLQGLLMPMFGIERPGQYQRDPLIDQAVDAAMPIDWEAAHVAAEELFPALVVDQVRPSYDGSRTLTLAGRLPGVIAERRVPRLVLDKQTLEPLHLYDPRNDSVGSTIFLLQEPLHFGDFAGNWSRLIWAVAGLAMVVVPLAGLVVYLKRQQLSMRSVKTWTWVSIAFAGATLVIHKWGGLIASLSYGFVIFFFLLLAAIALPVRGWIQKRKAASPQAHRRKQEPQTDTRKLQTQPCEVSKGSGEV